MMLVCLYSDQQAKQRRRRDAHILKSRAVNLGLHEAYDEALRARVGLDWIWIGSCVTDELTSSARLGLGKSAKLDAIDVAAATSEEATAATEEAIGCSTALLA